MKGTEVYHTVQHFDLYGVQKANWEDMANQDIEIKAKERVSCPANAIEEADQG